MCSPHEFDKNDSTFFSLTLYLPTQISQRQLPFEWVSGHIHLVHFLGFCIQEYTEGNLQSNLETTTLVVFS